MDTEEKLQQFIEKTDSYLQLMWQKNDEIIDRVNAYITEFNKIQVRLNNLEKQLNDKQK